MTLRPRHVLLGLLLAALGLALAEATQLWLGEWAQGRRSPWLLAFRMAVPTWLALMLLVPAIAWLAARLPLGPGERRRNIAVHTAASLLFPVVHMGIALPGWWALRLRALPDLDVARFFAGLLGTYFVMEVLIYWLIVGAWSAATYYRRWRQQELDAAHHASRAATLASGLSEAKLSALRAQLHPHFLFNTLNAIATLAEQRQHDAATVMTRRLSALLRAALEQGSKRSTVADEVRFLEQYLAIERVRFGERLDVVWRIEERCLDMSLPAMLLQPLVENAVKHGIAASPEPGTIEIGAAADDGTLRLWVRDSGPGMQPDAGTGIGLANTRARLHQLHGDDAVLELRPVPAGGTLAEVRIPRGRRVPA